MKTQFSNMLSSLFSSCSLILSVQDLENYLNLIIACISAIVLLINFGLRIYDRIKDGKYTEEEIKDTIEDLENIKDKIEEIKGDDKQ